MLRFSENPYIAQAEEYPKNSKNQQNDINSAFNEYRIEYHRKTGNDHNASKDLVCSEINSLFFKPEASITAENQIGAKNSYTE